MSLTDLFNPEFKQRNIGHFASTVHMALADGKISPQEKIFLDKLATNLEIPTSQIDEIMENPSKFHLNPPHSHNERLERLYDLARVIQEDRDLGDVQEKLLSRFCVALGFASADVDNIISKALVLAEKKVDLETFLSEMKKKYN